MADKGIYLAVMGVYLVLMIGIGFYFSKMKTFQEFALAGRTVSVPLFAMATLATAVGAGSILGLGGRGFNEGITGYWYIFPAVVPGYLLIGWFAASRLRASGYTTMGELIRDRYGPGARLASTFIMLFYLWTQMTLQVIAFGNIWKVLMGSSATTGMIIGTIIVLIYTAVGGLQAVIWTDAFQFLILVPGVVALVPITISAAGGWAQMRAVLPPAHFDLFSAGWVKIITWLLIMLPGPSLSAYVWNKIFAAKTERVAKMGMLWSAVLCGPFYLCPYLIGMAGRVVFPKCPAEQIVPMVMTNLLSPLGGALMLTVLLAVIMSSADSILLCTSNAFVIDVYKAYINPAADEAQMLRVGRNVTIIAGALSLLWAVYMPIINVIWTLGYAVLAGALFVPVWFGFFSKRYSRDSGLWSMIISGAFFIIWSLMKNPFKLDPIIPTLPLSWIILEVCTRLFPSQGVASDGKAAM